MNSNKKKEGKRITDRPKALVKKERGVWVYQGEMTSASIVELIDLEREKRTRELTLERGGS
jgi:hypothetical protein